MQKKQPNPNLSQERAASCPGQAVHRGASCLGLCIYHMNVGSGWVSLRPRPREGTLGTQPHRKGQGKKSRGPSGTLLAQRPPELWGPGLTLWSTRRWSWKGRRRWILGKDSSGEKAQGGEQRGNERLNFSSTPALGREQPADCSSSQWTSGHSHATDFHPERASLLSTSGLERNTWQLLQFYLATVSWVSAMCKNGTMSPIPALSYIPTATQQTRPYCCPCFSSFICSFNKYLLSIYNVPGTQQVTHILTES